jgi:hypothetical protein
MTPAPGEDAPPPLNGAGDCDSDAAQGLIGQMATAELGTQVLRMTGARAMRWIQPGQAVTMDFRSDRVNIKLDAQNRIEGITCG